MSIQANIERKLEELDCRLVRLTIALGAQMDHAVVLARRAGEYITWTAAQEGDDFFGLSHGHYGLDLREGLADFTRRVERL